MSETKAWMSTLCKDFGTIGNNMAAPNDSVIPMASPSLNWAVSNGGITEGKIVTWYGPESSGKSLLAQLMLIEIQKKYPEGIVIWFDAEYSFNKAWFAKLGGCLDRIIVRQSNDPVKIFDYIYLDCYKALQDGAPIKGICIDSIKSICYPGDVKDVSTKITMGGSGAKYLGPALKRIMPVIREFGVTTAFVQQVYEELDQFKSMTDPFLIPDGRALKHASDYMIEVTKVETKDGRIEEGATLVNKVKKAQVGHIVNCRVKKNRVGSPARIARFKLHYERGIIDTDEEICNLALATGVIGHPINPATGKTNVMYWQFKNYPPLKGMPNLIQWILDNPNITEEIYEECCNAANTKIQEDSKNLIMEMYKTNTMTEGAIEAVAELKLDLSSLNLTDANNDELGAINL